MTLEKMNERELWNEFDRVMEEWRKSDAQLDAFIWESRGTMLTPEKMEHYKRLHERLERATERQDRIREALRKWRGR